VIDVTAPSSPATIVDFAFVGPNRLARRDYGNGTRTEFVYNGITGVPNPTDDFGVKNVIETAHSLASSGSALAGHSYTWDGVGNKTSRNNSVDTLEQSFGYDAAYRLIESVRDGAATNYAIDLAHNRTQVTGAQNPGPYTFDATTPEPADAQMNQYTTTPQGSRAHDRNGNLLSDAPGRSFAYDYANRMVAYSGNGTEASYQYDALGRRIAKTVDGATARFYYTDGDRVCEEKGGRDAAARCGGPFPRQRSLRAGGLRPDPAVRGGMKGPGMTPRIRGGAIR